MGRPDQRQAAFGSAIHPRNGGSVWVCFFRGTAFLIAPRAIFGSVRVLFLRIHAALLPVDGARVHRPSARTLSQ